MTFSFNQFYHQVLKRPYQLAKRYDQGEGKTVVLLHGLASSSDVWKPLLHLEPPSGYRIVAFDLLGFGQSPKPDWPDYTVQQHAAAVMATIRRQRLKGPITIVGHSMGCLVSAHLTARYPNKFNHMILYQPPLFADIPEFKAYSRRSKVYLKAFGHIASRQELVVRYNKLIGQRSKGKGLAQVNNESWLPFERSLRNTIMSQGAYEELRDTPVRTDLIHGRLDLIVIRKDIKDMLDENPHITFHIVTDNHGVSARSAKLINRLIRT